MGSLCFVFGIFFVLIVFVVVLIGFLFWILVPLGFVDFRFNLLDLFWVVLG